MLTIKDTSQLKVGDIVRVNNTRFGQWWLFEIYEIVDDRISSQWLSSSYSENTNKEKHGIRYMIESGWLAVQTITVLNR